MHNLDLYAQAFYETTLDDPIKHYKEICLVLDVLEATPRIMDLILYEDSISGIVLEEFENEVSEITLNFLNVIIQDGLLSSLNTIKKNLQHILIDANLWNVCLVEYADTLTQKEKDELEALVKKTTHDKVEFSYRENTSLISGMRIKLNETIMDLSIMGRLQHLKMEVL